MAKTKESKAFLNYMHNELGITKTDIRRWTQEAVERCVNRRLDVMFKYDDVLPRMIDDAVRERSFDILMWGKDQQLDTVLQDKVVAQVTQQLIAEVGLEVKLTKKEKDNGTT